MSSIKINKSFELIEVNNTKIQFMADMLSNKIYRDFIHLADDTNNSVSHNLTEIRQLLASPTFYGIIAMCNHKQCGYLIGEVKRLNDGRVSLYLWYINVDATQRRKNIGSKMMHKMIAKCKAVGITFIVLSCDQRDEKVMRFYEKYGFVKDPILNKHDGMNDVSDNIVMCLYL